MKKVIVKAFISLAIFILMFEISGHLFSERQYYYKGERYYPIKSENPWDKELSLEEWKQKENSRFSLQYQSIRAFNQKNSSRLCLGVKRKV